MIKIISKITLCSAFVLVAQIVAQAHPGDLRDERLVISKLNFDRLKQIRKDDKSGQFDKCVSYDYELRESLGPLVQESMKPSALFQTVGQVISKQKSRMAREFTDCYNLLTGGLSEKSSQDDEPIKPAFVSDVQIIRGLDMERIFGKGSQIRFADKKCHFLDEQFRQLLGNITEGLSRKELFKRVACVVNKQSNVMYASLYWHLSSCLGEEQQFDRSKECWPLDQDANKVVILI